MIRTTQAAMAVLVGVLCLLLPLAPDRWSFWPLVLSPLWLLIPVVWRIATYSRRRG